ncbi:MAG: molecular chaperone HtpG [Spirochaetia bacterium]|jgi:molecular chaperone HtpG|nr:molecular chaperone HtpG [Spirochaetia bacterium]
MAKHQFQTEVNQLLQLIIHSLYSNKEIFIRELISNASDALDKLKHLTLTDENFKKFDFNPRIDIFFQEGEGSTLTIADTGIGMNEEELAENLGTIAKSGTRNFLQSLTGDAKRDSNLIGQFGVGFYSSFMVADSVEVISLKAGDDKAWRWVSDGKGEYEIEPSYRDTPGTSITLHLNEEGQEYASRWTIENVIKKYSDHIMFPIFLHYDDVTMSEEEGEKTVNTDQAERQINAASALWKRSKGELKDEDYKEFYKTISHDYDDPMFWVHTHAEGAIEYSTLFYVPGTAPVDMFRADYVPGVKLYVKRVFITDNSKDLLPVYLRFIRGIIDSEDLPLNVSREILQHNKVMQKIRSASVKKILNEIESMKNNNREKYEKFYQQYRVPLKEGLYQDYENKDTITNLLMFRSSKAEGYTSMEEYVTRMESGQKYIYFITGTLKENLKNSPLLEMYKQKDIEVLIMEDEIDELVCGTALGRFKDFDLKSVNRIDAAEDLKTETDKEREKEVEPLINKFKTILGDAVKNVKASARLTDSPACVVADETDPTIQMQHIMRAMGRAELASFKPILEINPQHEIIQKLINSNDEGLINDTAFLLLEQSMLIEGMELLQGAEFVKRMNRMMERAL